MDAGGRLSNYCYFELVENYTTIFSENASRLPARMNPFGRALEVTKYITAAPAYYLTVLNSKLPLLPTLSSTSNLMVIFPVGSLPSK